MHSWQVPDQRAGCQPLNLSLLLLSASGYKGRVTYIFNYIFLSLFLFHVHTKLRSMSSQSVPLSDLLTESSNRIGKNLIVQQLCKLLNLLNFINPLAINFTPSALRQLLTVQHRLDSDFCFSPLRFGIKMCTTTPTQSSTAYF